MKQKNMKRLLGLLLTGAMVVGTLTGCGSAETKNESKTESKAESSALAESKNDSSASATSEAAEETGVTYPIEGDVTLTLALLQESQVTSNGAKNLMETPFGKAWQEQTGVTIEVIQLADSDAMNLLFAGGDLPDLIYYNFQGGYPGGAAKAIKDKIIQPLNDYTDYLPDMMSALESDSDYIKSTMTDNGDIIGGPFVRDSEILRTSAGMMLREDWLNELGLEVPQTPDELYDVLKAFKEEKGVEAPWSSSMKWLLQQALGQGHITSPFGLVKTDFYQVDGIVHYGYYESEYKDVLAWLNKLYEEGLLDANFQTLDQATENSNIMNGVSGMTIGPAGSCLGTYINTMKESDPNYSLVGLAPLVANDGEVAMSTHYDNAVTGKFLVMSPQCENKEVAARFINYGYTEAGRMFFNFGIEGESYTMVDGYPTYTDVILNNPDGLTVQQAMAQYERAWQDGPFFQMEEYIEQYYQLDQQKQALAAWSTSNAADYQMPAVAIDEEDASEYSKLTADITVYIVEMVVKYITGQKSLDTFETEYLPTLKNMGVERVIEINQTALDRYNAR